MRKTFRTKPKEVEAIQWTGNNWDELNDFFKEKSDGICLRKNSRGYPVIKGQGWSEAILKGEWVVAIGKEIKKTWHFDEFRTLTAEEIESEYDEVIL